MLNKRIIAIVVVKNNIVVQSFNFSNYLPIGSPEITLEYLNNWGIDEIIYLDIDATKLKSEPNYLKIKNSTKKCYVPITYGGGIRSLDQISKLMDCGIDKISLNQTVLKNPSFIQKVANRYGNQCVVCSLDLMYTKDGLKTFDYIKKNVLDELPYDLIRKYEENGAGELLINFVNRDGMYNGFEIDEIQKICDITNIPVIAAGGAKNGYSYVDLFSKTKVDAGCAGNYFHFTEHSVTKTKAILNNYVNDIRIDETLNYQKNKFDKTGRLIKKLDSDLEKMLYIKIKEDRI